MRKYLRFAVWPLAACLALLVGGCAAGLPGLDYQRIDTTPDRIIAPSPGATLQPNFWELAAQEADEPRESRIYLSWPLPVTFNKYYFDISPDGTEARGRAYSMTGLGVPFIYLPLFYNTEYHYYHEGELEPRGSVKYDYTPFWANSRTTGWTDYDVVMKTGGIPLLWESGRVAGPKWHFDEYEKDLDTWKESSYTNILWWIGHSWEHTRTETPVRGQDGYRETETRQFKPFKLGGLLGRVLWSSYVTTDTEPDGSLVRRIGHGPLWGVPTWFEIHRRGPDASPAKSNRRYVLAGILWVDEVERDTAGRRISATHGPLWGFMGWGRSRESNHIRVFWIPIKI